MTERSNESDLIDNQFEFGPKRVFSEERPPATIREEEEDSDNFVQQANPVIIEP